MTRLIFAIVVLLTSQISVMSDATQPVLSGEVSIKQAVEAGLKYSPALAMLRATTQAESARLKASKAMQKLNGMLTAATDVSSMQMILNAPEGTSTIVPDRSRAGLNAMFIYPLSTGGGLESMVNAGVAKKDAAELDLKSSELDVAFNIKKAYREVLLSKMIIDAYKQRLQESIERVRIAEEAFTMGRIARYDLLRNKADLAESKRMVNDAQKDSDIAIVNLLNIMGVDQKSQIELSDVLSAEIADTRQENLMDYAIRNRPDIQAAKRRVIATEAMLKQARSKNFPQIYAIAMGEASGVRGMSFDKGYLLGVTASFPITDGGLRKSGIEEYQAMVSESTSAVTELENMVKADVSTAVIGLKTAKANLELADSAITQSEEDYAVIKMRYEAGKSTNVEVLDALAMLAQARTAKARAVFELNVSQDMLSRALGDL